MSDSDRLAGDTSVVRFLTGLLIALALIGVPIGIAHDLKQIQSLRAHKHDTASPEYYERKCQEQEALRLAVERPMQPQDTGTDRQKNKGAPADQTNQPDYCDLAAQYIASSGAKASANYAWWANLLTLCGLIALIYTLYLTREALAEAKNATRVTRNMGIAQTRAYLIIQEATPKWSEAHALADIRLKNSGNTPAGPVYVSFQYYELGGSNRTALLNLTPFAAQEERLLNDIKWADIKVDVAYDGGGGVNMKIERTPHDDMILNGIVHYKDVFNHWQQTHFNFAGFPKKFKRTPTGNDYT